MPWVNRSFGYSSTAERVCAGLSYFTFGVAGLLYLLLGKSRSQTELFRFHMVQATLLWVLSTLIAMAAQPLFGILFGLTRVVAPGPTDMAQGGVVMIWGVVTLAFTGLLIYGAVFAFLEKFAEVPFISGLVRANMSRWGN